MIITSLPEDFGQVDLSWDTSSVTQCDSHYIVEDRKMQFPKQRWSDKISGRSADDGAPPIFWDLLTDQILWGRKVKEWPPIGRLVKFLVKPHHKISSNTGNVKRFPYIFVVCLNKPPFLETDIIVMVYLDLSGTVNHSWQASVWFAKEGVTPVINHVFPFTDQLCVYPQISSQTTKTTIRF